MTEEKKPEIEREYTVPLRKQVMKVPIYRRTKKAVKTLKEFLAKHMKVENRDIRKVKLNKYLNQEIWFRGIKHPPAKIKVKAKKIDGIVFVELAEIPKIVQYQIDREERQKSKESLESKVEEKKEEKSEEQKKEEQEKEKATQEAGLKAQKQEAKQEKHTSKQKQTKINRMAMQR